MHLEINEGESVEKYKHAIKKKMKKYIKEKNKIKKLGGRCPKTSAFFTVN